MNIKLPTIAAFNDYHDVDYLLDQLKELSKSNLKAKKLNPEDYGFGYTKDHDLLYYGLFYTGKIPSKQNITKLLAKRILNDGWLKTLKIPKNAKELSIGDIIEKGDLVLREDNIVAEVHKDLIGERVLINGVFFRP